MIPAQDIPKEHLDEWKHIYETRIGILCEGKRQPTHEEHMMAFREATEHVRKLSK